MATRKTASKTSKKVQADFDFNAPSKKTTKKVKSKLKKVSPAAIFLAIVLLIVGAVGGYFGVKFLTKNDCFEIVGNDKITLTLDENYTDEGVKVIAFGKDEAKNVKVETNLTKEQDGTYSAKDVGTYYIKYTVDNIKYGSIFKIQKVRLITFIEAPEQEEIDKAEEV